MILTRSGLVIRKSSAPDSKLHLILSLHYPLSINPSDTLSIGLNGALVRGYCPRLTSTSTNSSSSSSSSGLIVAAVGSVADEDLIGSAIVEDDDEYHLSHGSTETTSHRQRLEAVHKEVTPRLVELGFDSKDQQGEWIDAIMDHYFTISKA